MARQKKVSRLRTLAVSAKLEAVIHDAEEGGYWAEVPALPGCYTQAETLAELRRNIRIAVDLYLDESPVSVGARRAAASAQKTGRAAKPRRPKTGRKVS